MTRMRMPFGAARGQRGISLLIVMVVVLLSSLLALWAFRSSLVNETIVGNDADYLRAFEAAQAMIQDAEFDIRGERPDGSPCVPATAVVYRCLAGADIGFVVETEPDFPNLMERLESAPTKCVQGICQMRTGQQDFWNDQATWDAMTAAGVGARYGEYTGALNGGETGTASNPILKSRAANQGAWYWIEVMRYAPESSGLSLSGQPQIVPLVLNPRVVYRITAIARGLKPRTQVVLQSTYVRQKRS